jgi:agmatine deiminase
MELNGRGTLISTEQCYLDPKIQVRNPGLRKKQIEGTLKNYLGVTNIFWLRKGPVGDDTHGHIDDTARFASPATILACVEPDKSDPNHAPMRENLKRLQKMRDTRGKQFTLAELPLPAPVYFENQRLPASYANFYIANAGVLVPVFNDPNDLPALKIIEQAFKGRAGGVIPIYCRDLVWGLGTLHCMTQQQPAT